MPEATGITKLSQAMRVGAKQTYQIHGDFVNMEKREGKLGACALGAAALALGMDPKPEDSHWYYSVVRFLNEKLGIDLENIDLSGDKLLGDCTDCGDGVPLPSAVIFLNDDKGLGMKEIASWLEGKGY